MASAEERFFAKVEKTDACWLWRGAVSPSGHGVFRGAGDKTMPAHHFSYALTGASKPRALRLLHSCEQPSCVNPSHLFIGTPENMLKRCSVARRSGCIEWTGVLDSGGYGNVGIGGRAVLTHRLAWQLAFGDPGRRCVLHRCDNRKCINPAHLFLGTKADNNIDRDTKGRTARGERLAMHGEDNHRARLTAKQVTAIRKRASSGATQSALAAEYGVHQSLISGIVNRKYWAHV